MEVNAKKKIFFCIDNMLKGGTELQLAGLLKELDKTKYELHLLTIRETDRSLVPEGVYEHVWSVDKLFSIDGLVQFFKLVRLLKKERVDIVQTYFQDSTIFAGSASWLARVPLRIACFRDMAFWNNKKQAIVMTFVYKLMNRFLCNAEIIKAHFSSLFHISKKLMLVVPNGIDSTGLEPSFDVIGDVKNIVIVGNMSREVKRIDLFIKAAEVVNSKYPDLKWHIVGEGYLREDLEKLARDLGLDSDIMKFCGSHHNVRNFLKGMDVGIICSDSEGLSNAILEYMLEGVSVVATDVGGNKELVDSEQTGLLTEPGNAIALAESIVNLVENKDLRIKLSRNAYELVSKRYSWANCVRVHEDVYWSTDDKGVVNA